MFWLPVLGVRITDKLYIIWVDLSEIKFFDNKCLKVFSFQYFWKSIGMILCIKPICIWILACYLTFPVWGCGCSNKPAKLALLEWFLQNHFLGSQIPAVQLKDCGNLCSHSWQQCRTIEQKKRVVTVSLHEQWFILCCCRQRCRTFSTTLLSHMYQERHLRLFCALHRIVFFFRDCARCHNYWTVQRRFDVTRIPSIIIIIIMIKNTLRSYWVEFVVSDMPSFLIQTFDIISSN